MLTNVVLILVLIMEPVWMQPMDIHAIVTLDIQVSSVISNKIPEVGYT